MPIPPEDRLEREYQSLLRKLRAARGFCFVVFFVEDRRASQFIRNRLREGVAPLSGKLVEIAVGDRDSLVATTMAGLLGAERTSDRGLRDVYWVEAFIGRGEAGWQTQRNELLMRMNERRGRLERELHAPLILLLPAGAERDAATLAPDLWHVRLHSAVLVIQGSELESLDKNIDKLDLWLDGFVPNVSAAAGGVPSSGVPREVAYWNSLLDSARRETQSHGADPIALDGLALYDGAAAVDAWLRSGDTASAIELAKDLELIARDRVARMGGAEQPESLQAAQGLLMVLVKVGDALRSNGQTTAAVSRYRDCLEIALTILDRENGPPTKDAIDVLLLALQKVGDAELELGRFAEADKAFHEALIWARASLERFGASAPQIRTLAGMLTRVGQASHYQGHCDEALEYLQEASLHWRSLLPLDGGDPRDLRALSRSLIWVGDAERGTWTRKGGPRCLSRMPGIDARPARKIPE